ncbi:hypothetical protein Dda_5322 [Drechslerella dactyloides]|uniref:Uncharacterized protein n=1 Tax=Drechslerella dactyloides TaxID=74499 RepID=A0AAD6IXB4_DREDA|nr:hypothetical protein Dda_5322 [Drechslerella dactyloides]
MPSSNVSDYNQVAPGQGIAFPIDSPLERFLQWNPFTLGLAARLFMSDDSPTVRQGGQLPALPSSNSSESGHPPTLATVQSNFQDSGYSTGHNIDLASQQGTMNLGSLAPEPQISNPSHQSDQADRTSESGYTGVHSLFKTSYEHFREDFQPDTYGMKDNLFSESGGRDRYHNDYVVPPSADDVKADLTTKPNGSSPTAYLMQEDQTGARIVVDIDGRPISFLKAQKETYYGDLPFPPPLVYTHSGPCPDDTTEHDPTTDAGKARLHKHTITYTELDVDGKQSEIDMNPIHGTQGVPQYSRDLIPAFDMGYYVDILRLPDKPQDMIVYLSSLCSALALTESQWEWIQENLDEATVRNNALDECIFEMIDFLNPDRLRDDDGKIVFAHLPEEPSEEGRLPTLTTMKDWHEEVDRCRRQHRRMSSLAYSHVLNRGKVMAVWYKMREYRDNWANELFSGRHHEDWELEPENYHMLKEYHAFDREMQRLLMTIESDLIKIGRLENTVTALGVNIWKAEDKLDLVMERFES